MHRPKARLDPHLPGATPPRNWVLLRLTIALGVALILASLIYGQTTETATLEHRVRDLEAKLEAAHAASSRIEVQLETLSAKLSRILKAVEAE